MCSYVRSKEKWSTLRFYVLDIKASKIRHQSHGKPIFYPWNEDPTITLMVHSIMINKSILNNWKCLLCYFILLHEKAVSYSTFNYISKNINSTDGQNRGKMYLKMILGLAFLWFKLLMKCCLENDVDKMVNFLKYKLV